MVGSLMVGDGQTLTITVVDGISVAGEEKD